jgi:hypothetical protein
VLDLKTKGERIAVTRRDKLTVKPIGWQTLSQEDVEENDTLKGNFNV